MASNDTWINPRIRYRMNEHALKEDMQDCPDIDLGHFDDVDVDFGAILKDTITILNNDKHRGRTTKTVVVLSDNHPLPRRPRFLRLRVYWARLRGWRF
ncbi:hypothetical protein N7457_005112 [Penicillium paradoxum]|uniref:uncharacterized protein n=1 Tax=Penicillium paradoxum TaxID=176176 RepID=UPI0025499FE3|nr:uncharacterized protein N7457_005112 [Penicillium paradoxum]KAJ5779952.1 hypothetical protein N7457_005112 [Penicillium paradoxum]